MVLFNISHLFENKMVLGINRLNISIWPIDGNLIGTTTSVHSGPGSYDNEEVVHISKNSSTGASQSDAV